MRSLTIIFCAVLIVFSLHQAQARIIHVPADSSTIQGGINGAVNGDTVLVSPGIYSEPPTIQDKSIVLASEFLLTGDTSTIHQTVIDGQLLSIIGGLPDTNCVVSGFTINRGISCWISSPTISHNYIINGAGIKADNVGQVRVLSNTITGNVGPFAGGISLLTVGSILIKQNVIAGNQGEKAGGICIYTSFPSSVIIEENLIVRNIAVNGAAVYCNEGGFEGPISILNNTISHNTAVYAGGIYCASQTNVTIRNNIITNSVDGFGIYYDTPKTDLLLPLISYNDIWNNADGEYGGSCPNQTGFNGNISANPLFCDWQNGNYFLFNTSPCVGAGEGGSNIGSFGVGCGSNYGVSVSSGPDTVTTVNTQIQIGFAVQNIGLVQDNYDVHISDSLGWTLDPTYLQMSLNPGQSDSLVVTVSIPATLNYTKNTIKLSATSQAQPSTSDSDDLIITALSLCGDANHDGVVNVTDVVYLINYLFIGGPKPCEP